MSRVALIAPEHRVRAMLVALAESGSAQLVGPLPAAEGEAVDALRRLERAHPEVAKAAPRVAEAPSDVAALEDAGQRDLLAGEV